MSELRPCPFCGVNEWQYHAHFSGASVFQCEKCGAIVDECVLNTRPIEDALTARIAELEEFKMIVEGCGFKVLTEPPVLNHPERKILQGHGVMYVPTPPEVQE